MKIFLNADDVAKICEVKKSTAYNIIKTVNKEMEKKGYIVIRGKVNSTYFLERLGLGKEAERSHDSSQRW